MDKWVSNGGSDFNSGTQQFPWQHIQYGVEHLALAGGGTLHVFPGLYPENVKMIGRRYSNIKIKRFQMGNSIVDGGAKDRVFQIRDVTGVRLEGLIIRNGRVDKNYRDGSGGGVLVREAQADLIGCTFSGNVAYAGAGFAYLKCRTGIMSTILECNAVSNRAVDYNRLSLAALKAVVGFGGGGAIIDTDKVNVITSRFSRNRAFSRGAGGLGILGSRDVTVKQQCRFELNYAIGGILNVIDRRNHYWEVARGGAIGISGCSQVPSSIVIDQAVIRKNFAEYFGGGISISNTSYVKIASGNQLTENWTDHEGGGVAIVQLSALDFAAAEKAGFWQDFGGYGLFPLIPPYLFRSPVPAINVVADLAAGKTVRIEKNRFESNVAREGGGGLYVTDSAAVLLVKNILLKNRTTGGTGGGGLHASWNSFLDIVGPNEFLQNEAAKGNGGGGGLFARNTHVRMTGANLFQGNLCPDHGGGAYIYTGPEADQEPFAFMFEDYLRRAGFAQAQVTLDGDTQFIGHTTADIGGALYVAVVPTWHIGEIDLKLRIVNRNRFVQNAASGDGGALFASRIKAAQIEDGNLFDHNQAGGDGGGMCFSECEATSIQNNKAPVAGVLNNEATVPKRGGGTAFLRCVDPKIAGNAFTNNTQLPTRAADSLWFQGCKTAGVKIAAPFGAALTTDNTLSSPPQWTP